MFSKRDSIRFLHSCLKSKSREVLGNVSTFCAISTVKTYSGCSGSIHIVRGTQTVLAVEKLPFGRLSKVCTRMELFLLTRSTNEPNTSSVQECRRYRSNSASKCLEEQISFLRGLDAKYPSFLSTPVFHGAALHFLSNAASALVQLFIIFQAVVKTFLVHFL